LVELYRRQGRTFGLTGRLLNGYFTITYNSTKHQQVIHNLRRRAKIALFEFWLSFFSFVHLTLIGAQIRSASQSQAKNLLLNIRGMAMTISLFTYLVNLKT
jgi:hypothetical protein